MIMKVVKKLTLGEAGKPESDLLYWLSRPPEERVAAVDLLRRLFYGDSIRLQRSARVVQRPRR
jgi:hypothetical protein